MSNLWTPPSATHDVSFKSGTLKDGEGTTTHKIKVVDPETNKRCGKFMRNWDEMFYNQYGMCEDCYLKYNSHVDEIKEKLDNAAGEVVKEE